MEVAPTAHYTMGGIVVDPQTHATNVPGLYAAGECVGGLHGANRLGGNSLGEALISGRHAGEAAAAFALEGEVFIRSRRVINEGLDELDALTRPGAELARPLQCRLRDVMWERCGVVRDENGLRKGLREIEALRETAADVDVQPSAEGWTDLAHALDLRAGLVVAEATLRGAIERRETRGAHNCTDFPDLDPALQVNFYVDARMDPWSEHVPGVPGELREPCGPQVLTRRRRGRPSGPGRRGSGRACPRRVPRTVGVRRPRGSRVRAGGSLLGLLGRTRARGSSRSSRPGCG